MHAHGLMQAWFAARRRKEKKVVEASVSPAKGSTPAPQPPAPAQMPMPPAPAAFPVYPSAPLVPVQPPTGAPAAVPMLPVMPPLISNLIPSASPSHMSLISVTSCLGCVMLLQHMHSHSSPNICFCLNLCLQLGNIFSPDNSSLCTRTQPWRPPASAPFMQSHSSSLSVSVYGHGLIRFAALLMHCSCSCILWQLAHQHCSCLCILWQLAHQHLAEE